MLHYTATARSNEISDVKNAVGLQVWNQALKQFESLMGLSTKQASKILISSPAIAKLSEASIQQNIGSLQALGFKTAEVKQMILEDPRLLLCDPRLMRKNYLNLQKQLGDCDSQIAAQESPNTLIENELTTNEKIDYCTLEMCLPKKMISKSKILKCDLQLIRTRHGFAYRAGYYRRINPKHKTALDENPKISELIFSSNEKFLSICKGLTLEEYVVFESMITQEENTYKTEDDMGLD